MNYLVSIVFIVIAACLQMLPLTGIYGRQTLKHQYDLDFDDNNMRILIKHRAALFGMIGFFMVYAAFDSQLQHYAIAAGLVNACTFILIAKLTKPYSVAIRRNIHGYWLSIFCLIVASVFLVFK